MNSSCGREEKSREVEIRRVEKEVGERKGKKKGWKGEEGEGQDKKEKEMEGIE